MKTSFSFIYCTVAITKGAPPFNEVELLYNK